MSVEQVVTRISDQHLDELDLIITRAGDGFAVADVHGGPTVGDIGSSYEIPDSADERGERAFTAGPWTAYQYHASFTAPNRSNYEDDLVDLAAGDISALIVGCAPAGPECDTWVFGIRTES